MKLSIHGYRTVERMKHTFIVTTSSECNHNVTGEDYYFIWGPPANPTRTPLWETLAQVVILSHGHLTIKKKKKKIEK